VGFMVHAVSDLRALPVAVVAQGEGLRSGEVIGARASCPQMRLERGLVRALLGTSPDSKRKQDEYIRKQNRLRKRLEILRRDSRRESSQPRNSGGHHQPGGTKRSREDDADESDDGTAAPNSRTSQRARHSHRPP